MGLDITAYEFIELDPEADTPQTDEDYDKLHQAHILAYIPSYDFHYSQEGLVENGWYTYSGEREGYCIGPYSYYNAFRRTLCEAFLQIPPGMVWENHEVFKDRPFFELINFSDCEGLISPIACERLDQDFKDHAVLVERLWGGGNEYVDVKYGHLNTYKQFAQAFALAKSGGAVKFH